MFDPVKLKQIALAKREEKKLAEHTDELAVPAMFTQEQVQIWVKDLEGHVVSFADDGNLSVEYIFKPEHPVQAVHAVASEFKLAHPKLMVITEEGTKTITVTWDGQNHV